MKELSLKTRFLNSARLLFRNRIVESMLYPITKGKTNTQLLSRIPANYYQYRKGSIRKVERNGFQFALDISDYMQWLIYFGILSEPREKLYSLITPGMTVLDVGANVGETSMQFSRLCGKDGAVISFEPDPDTFVRLNKHLVSNQCKNVNALNIGLGKNVAELILQETENNSGGNHIASSENAEGKKISISKMDLIVKELKLNRVDFVKIDVEGYEFEVLLGAEEVLTDFHPILFIEINDSFLKAHNASAEELIRFLKNKNYSITNAENGSEIKAGMDFTGLHFDIIAS